MASLITPSDGLSGLDDARRIIAFHDDRLRVHRALQENLWLSDPRIAAVHVEPQTQADMIPLVGYGAAGEFVVGDMFYLDAPIDGLTVVPEFDTDSTGAGVPAGSALAERVSAADGWVVDMAALRAYDPAADRAATRRSAFVALLGDMMATGEAHGFFDPGE